MAISDIVSVSITTESAGASAAGYGVQLILSTNASGWVERTRSYSTLSAVVVDFASTTPEYKAAAAAFAQSPSPSRVIIGRLVNKPTQRVKITIASVLNSTAYRVKVGANTATFTSDASATNDEIAAGLTTAINALSGDTVTATTDTSGGAGFHFVYITGNAAGTWDAVEILDVTLLALAVDHADPGYAADLAAIKLENNDWYGIQNSWNSKAVVLAIAAYAEANEKLFVAATQDSAVITTAVGGTDVADDLKDANYARTAAIYHPNNGSFIDAAWMGKCLPKDPGSETWKFKLLAGVPVVTLTDTHITNLKAKNCNYYTSYGTAITAEGKVAAGEFIDVVRFRDWLRNDMQIAVYNLLAANDKVPFTDEGIAMVEGVIRGSLARGVAAKGLANNPAPFVTVPKASAVSASDKASRTLKNVFFGGTLAGAVHATEIKGTLTL